MLYLWLFKWQHYSSAWSSSPHRTPAHLCHVSPPIHSPARAQSAWRVPIRELGVWRARQSWACLCAGPHFFLHSWCSLLVSICRGQTLLYDLTHFSDMTSSKRTFMITQPEMMSPSGELPNTIGFLPSATSHILLRIKFIYLHYLSSLPTWNICSS